MITPPASQSFPRLVLLDLDGASERLWEQARAAFAYMGHASIAMGAEIDAASRELRELLASPRAPSPRDLLDEAFASLPLFGRSLFTGFRSGLLCAPVELRGDRSPRALQPLHARAPRSSWVTARRAFCSSRRRDSRTACARRQAATLG